MTQAELVKEKEHYRECMFAVSKQLADLQKQHAQLVEALKDAQSVLLHATNVPYRYELLERIKLALNAAKGAL